MDALKTYLDQFWKLDETSFEPLRAALVERQYPKATVITAEGQTQRELLFITKGVQMAYYHHQDKINVLAFTYPISVSGIPDSFFFQIPSKCALQAITDTEASVISYTSLTKLFDGVPFLERLFRKLAETVLAGLIQRHIELQAYTIEERFRAFAKRSPHLFQLVPHKYIASYLHIDPTNFSKLYNSIKL